MYFFTEFDKQATVWQQEHQGKPLSGLDLYGHNLHMQADLFSPLSFIDYAEQPNRFNFAKMLYMPSMSYGTYWLTAKITGSQIPSLAVRMINQGHNTVQIAQHTARTSGMAIVRWAPYVAAVAAVAALGYYGNEAYARLSGTAGIGDMRIKYK